MVHSSVGKGDCQQSNNLNLITKVKENTKSYKTSFELSLQNTR